MTQTPQTHACRSPVYCVLVAALLVLFPVTQAIADAVKTADLWVDDVSILNVTAGQLIYSNAAGDEVTRPLAVVQGLKVTAYPELAQAQEAMDAGKDAQAAELLMRVNTRARQPWLKSWTRKLAVGALDRANKPSEAVEMVIGLLRDKPHPAFIPEMPIASLSSAPAAQKEALVKRLQQSLASFDAAGVAAVQPLIEVIGSKPPEGNGATQPTHTTGTHGTTTPLKPGESAVALPLVLIKGPADEVTTLLRRGEFQAALDKVNDILSKPTAELGMRLYQRGVAELSLADAASSIEGYKDAGLSFMSAVIYFPRGSYTGASLVEAAYVHHKIGDNDTANKLLTRASLVMDLEKETDYAKRIDAIRGMMSVPVNTEPETPEP